MSTIAEFEVPSVFTFCRRVGHDGRMEVLRVVTTATCRNRKIGKFNTVVFHTTTNNNNICFVHFTNPQGIMCRSLVVIDVRGVTILSKWIIMVLG